MSPNVRPYKANLSTPHPHYINILCSAKYFIPTVLFELKISGTRRQFGVKKSGFRSWNWNFFKMTHLFVEPQQPNLQTNSQQPEPLLSNKARITSLAWILSPFWLQLKAGASSSHYWFLFLCFFSFFYDSANKNQNWHVFSPPPPTSPYCCSRFCKD